MQPIVPYKITFEPRHKMTASPRALQKHSRKSLVSRGFFARNSALILRRAPRLRKTMEFREKWRSRF